MRVVHINKGEVKEESCSRSEAVTFMHELAEQYFPGIERITSDMDGVLIQDDNAIMAARAVSGPDAQKMFSQYADLNIKAVSEGQTSYCWYAPTLFVGQLLNGLSPEINKVVGQNMRLIPGARRFVDSLGELGVDITAVTAGHQEAADEVSRRLGIENTIGTQLGISNGVYYGTVKRFIGGEHKLKFVRGIIGDNGQGTHIGDSWSDVETLKDVRNSIAFNPGCDKALRNANISLIGISLAGLIPFFDPEGKYDGRITEEELPKTLVLTEGIDELAMQRLLGESKHIKKATLEAAVTFDQGSRNFVEATIRQQLTTRGIDFKTQFKDFMSLEEFDRYAKDAYIRLN